MLVSKRINEFLLRFYRSYENYQRKGNVDILHRALGDKMYFKLKSFFEVRSVAHLYSYKRTKARLKTIVVLFDGKVYGPGLADILRALATVYHWCKENEIVFKIKCSFPFNLSEYLIPNNYSWELTKDELDYNCACPKALISYNNIFGVEKNIELHRVMLDSYLNSGYEQIHLYTNTYCYDSFFHESFCELFKPSQQLETKLVEFKNLISEDYVSISFRFTQLLGDLKDSFGKPLALEEREELINKCIDSIKPIIEHNGVNKALVTSDSVNFLHAVAKLQYVYLLPGAVGNIINKVTDEQIDKTFWDMFMISRAKKAYMVRTKQMYRSGFAMRAAMIGDIPFEELIID